MNRFLLLLFLFILSASFLSAQDKIYSDIERAFQRGDEKAILNHAADRVLLDIDKKESVYSKAQAAMILRDFFTKNRTSAFQLIFKGNAKGSSAYAVGVLESGAKKFRVTITLKETSGIFKIEQLSIEED